VKDDLEAALKARRPEARAEVIEDMLATGRSKRKEECTREDDGQEQMSDVKRRQERKAWIEDKEKKVGGEWEVEVLWDQLSFSLICFGGIREAPSPKGPPWSWHLKTKFLDYSDYPCE